jgi:hypothetical protein
MLTPFVRSPVIVVPSAASPHVAPVGFHFIYKVLPLIIGRGPWLKVTLSVEIKRQSVDVSDVEPSAHVPETVSGILAGPVCRGAGKFGNAAVATVVAVYTNSS